MTDVEATLTAAMPQELHDLVQQLGVAQKRFVVLGWQTVGTEGRRDSFEFIASGATKSARGYRSRIVAWRMTKIGETAI